MTEFNNNSPILVTGSHRSGSTWVGRMLALASNVTYIQEPFNLAHRPGICRAHFDYWFTYISAENEALYFHDIERCLQFKYNLFNELKIVRSRKGLSRMRHDYMCFLRSRLYRLRPLMKDPIAVFSTEWLAMRFDMNVITVIRHPAAFVGSLKKANWGHPFEHFLKQPLLMEQYLMDYQPLIEEYARDEKDIIDQGILLWNMIHDVILKYKNNNLNGVFVRHEDLSANPVDGFSQLYQQMGLEFTPKIQQTIMDFSNTSRTNSSELKRDSKSNILEWKNRLHPDEIKKIKEKTAAISSQFYSEEDWGE